MKIIKGLLLKDLLELKSYKRNFLLSILIYGFIIITQMNEGGVSFMASFMIMFLFSLYAISTFNYDEKTQSDRYVLTFPLTRKDVIKSKYILGILSIIFGSIIGLVLSFGLSYIVLKKIPSIGGYFSELTVSFYIISLIQCFQIPFIYKYGAEKGRNQIYIITLGLSLLIILFSILFPNVSYDFINKMGLYLYIIVFFLIIFNYYFSFIISYKVYSKKDI